MVETPNGLWRTPPVFWEKAIIRSSTKLILLSMAPCTSGAQRELPVEKQFALAGKQPTWLISLEDSLMSSFDQLKRAVAEHSMKPTQGMPGSWSISFCVNMTICIEPRWSENAKTTLFLLLIIAMP